MPNCFAIDFSNPSPVIVLQLVLLAVHASVIVYRQNERRKEMYGVHERLDRIFNDRATQHATKPIQYHQPQQHPPRV